MARQWFGLLLGFVGVTLVISGKFGLQTALGSMLIPALAALLGITIGTLYQKRFCSGFDLRTGSVIQLAQRADSQRQRGQCRQPVLSGAVEHSLNRLGFV